MIEILELNEDNIFGLKLDGKFDAEDVQRVFESITEKIKGEGRIRLYYEIGEFDLGSISKEMIEDEVRYLFKHPGLLADIEKISLVTDSAWLKKIAAVEFALIPTVTGKTFSTREKETAMEWLKKDHRAEYQMDVVFPELAELGTVKALGGLGIGLLAANLLSRGQRTKIGTLALAGSFLLGIPLAAKLLNNNRHLLNG